MNFLAAVSVGLGVTLFFDLGEGLLGRAVDFQLKDKDTFGGLGDQIGAAMGLPVFGGDAEEAARGQQDIEDTLEGEFLDVVFFGTVGDLPKKVAKSAPIRARLTMLR